MTETEIGAGVHFSAALIWAVAPAAVDACAIIYSNTADEPVMAQMVREADAVVLARIIGARPLPLDDMRAIAVIESYEYTAQPVENLKGYTAGSFTFRASDPAGGTVPEHCGSTQRIFRQNETDPCRVAASLAASAERQQAEAARGHDHVSFFADSGSWYFSSNLSGAAARRPEIHSSCTTTRSFLEGQTYVLFLDQDGERMGVSSHIYMVPVSEPDDEWVAAVRYFAANPQRDRLPGTPMRDWISRAEQVSRIDVESCDNETTLEWHRVALSLPWEASVKTLHGNDLEVATAWAMHDTDAYDDCEPGQAFLITDHAMDAVFPIANGVVDFTSVKSQFEITGDRLVPYEIVENWFDDPR